MQELDTTRELGRVEAELLLRGSGDAQQQRELHAESPGAAERAVAEWLRQHGYTTAGVEAIVATAFRKAVRSQM
eukprot:COSAG01_NODE_9230_length_2512_cov_6.851637_2_plen_74_part_00